MYAEQPTNLGWVDGVLELADTVYILEFKMTTGEIALQPIHDNRYALSFLGGQKKIILLGIAFDKEKRNIADWEKAIISQLSSLMPLLE